jgi:serine/threonine protein kinase
MYAMCTGRPPFRAETSYGILRRISDDRPHPIREVNNEIPAWLESIINRLLAKSPDERFPSAEELATLLEECLAHVQQPTVSPLPKSLWGERKGFPDVWLDRKSVTGIAIGIAILAAVTLATSLMRDASSPDSTSIPAATSESAVWSDGVTDEFEQMDDELPLLEERAARSWDDELSIISNTETEIPSPNEEPMP